MPSSTEAVYDFTTERCDVAALSDFFRFLFHVKGESCAYRVVRRLVTLVSRLAQVQADFEAAQKLSLIHI